MRFSLEIRPPQLRVFSSVFSNLAAGWFAAIFITHDRFLLTADIVGVIVSLYLAIKTEEILEER